MINKIVQYVIKNKILLVGLLVVAVIAAFYFLQTIAPQINQRITTPVLPGSLPELQTSYPDDVFPKKTLNLNWNNTAINIPPSSKKYLITKSLVNKDTVIRLSLDLDFVPNDLLKSRKETSRTWSNKKASLFTSLDQNQIIYSRKNAFLGKTSTIDDVEAISISQTLIYQYFGQSFLTTLDPKPTVRFLLKDAKSYGPTTVSNPYTAEYVEIAYKQVINSFPLSSLSGNTNILTIVIDNQRNLNRLEIYGGYLELSSLEEQNLLDPNIFKSVASEKALKITSLSNVSQEAAYLNSSNINVDVKNAFFGYFLASDSSVVPVVFISGTIQANQLNPESSTFVVPVGSL